MTKVLSTMVFVPPSLLCLSCMPPPTPPVPVRAPNNYKAHAQVDGLSAGAEVFDTFAKSTGALGNNVTSEFTPVQLVLESAAVDKFHLHRDNAKLVCANGTTLEAVSGLAMYENFRENPAGNTVARANFRAAAILFENDTKKTEWMEREFPAETIVTAGRRTAGLLYFRGTCNQRTGRKLRIKVDKLISSDAIVIALDLR